MTATETLWDDLRAFLGQPDLTREELEAHRWDCDAAIREARVASRYDEVLATNDLSLRQLAAWHLEDRRGFDGAPVPPRPGATLLDFGAGIGTRGIAHALRGWRVDFCEINGPSRAFLEFRLDRLQLAGGVWATLQSGLEYDKVLCMDVVGHLSDPLLLAQVSRAVASGGTLCINWDNWDDGVHAHADFPFTHLLAECGLRPGANGSLWLRPA